MTGKRLWIVGSILVVLALLAGIFGCATTTTSTTQSTTTQSTTTRTTSTQATTTQTTTGPAKTLKIGLAAYMESPIGLDQLHATEVAVDMENASGGLSIGGQRYNVDLIYYDTKNDPASTTAAINRLIYEDGVKYICMDYDYMDVAVPIAEANHVVLIGFPILPTLLAPSNHYTFDGSVFFACLAVSWGWLHNYKPNLKTVDITNLDDESGHAGATTTTNVIKNFGFTVISSTFYPENITDASALGLRMVTDNPDIALPLGGLAQGALSVKGMYQAGYKGVIFIPEWPPAAEYLTMTPVPSMENVIAGAWPVEFDPASTPVAQTFKSAWIAKFGSWAGAEIELETDYEILVAAFQQTGSLDPDALQTAIANGLKWEGPEGPGVMAPRLDLGNTRTVSSVVGYAMKGVHNGNPVLLGSIDLNAALKYFEQVYHS